MRTARRGFHEKASRCQGPRRASSVELHPSGRRALRPRLHPHSLVELCWLGARWGPTDPVLHAAHRASTGHRRCPGRQATSAQSPGREAPLLPVEASLAQVPVWSRRPSYGARGTFLYAEGSGRPSRAAFLSGSVRPRRRPQTQKQHALSLRATATTARRLPRFPPRAARARPQRRKSVSGPNGPRM